MYKKPQLRFFVVLAAFLAVFLVTGNSADAKTASGKGVTEGRYFVESKSVLIKSLFGVQHDFSGGFTSDLTTGEVWTLEKIFKVNVIEVPLYKINAVSSDTSATAGSIVTDAVDLISGADQKAKEREILPDSQIPWGVKKVYGDNVIFSTNGGKNVNIAVLDTGANIKHEDLSARIKDCKDFTRGPVPRSACEDKQGHGTHIAGIISADGGTDGKGVWGIASEASLLIYKVCRNDGTCWADDIASAAIYASNNGANIILIGLGGNADNFLMRDASAEAVKNNVLIVASAGNDGADKGSIDFPAAYKDIVSVSAFSEEGTVPDWSSRGINDGDYIKESKEIEFTAPGENIESAWIDGGYRYLSGSSMSAAHVTGIAAKLWNGVATSTDAKLRKIARDVWTIGDDSSTGFGIPIFPRTVESD
jgi:subtilisin